MSGVDDAPFEDLLEFLKTSRGFDFTGYKRASLKRRISRRMQDVGISSVGAYLDHLQVHPDEFVDLFNTILINVTSFFRDPEHWDYLASEILPQFTGSGGGERPIRVWSAGCASGEEAYTVAMLLAEALGDESFRRRVKIYATDVDEEALDEGRRAVYDETALEPVPEEFRERYFRPANGGLAFRPDLRAAVVFGRHDLIRDAPISRLDLLVCRNVLMYVTRDTQHEILEHLHFGLKQSGFLFLGNAEMLLAGTDLFEPVDLAHRVFRKVPTAAPVRRPEADEKDVEPTEHDPGHARVREAAFGASRLAQLVVDASGTVVLANRAVQTLFGLLPTDVGRPLRDLEVSYRPVDLRSPVEQAVEERRSVHLRNVERHVRDEPVQYLDVWVVPLVAGDDELLGVSVAFDNVTRYEGLRARLQQTNQDLETAYEELQSTNEELETTNEELQSTIEELETTNEELQSSNEELETMNEELQSANAEQDEMTRLMHERADELDRVTLYLRSILASVVVGVVVVDDDLTVQLWNDHAHELWGLRSDEVVGHSLLDLDIGLPVDQLAGPVRTTLGGQRPDAFVIEATNRRGRSVDCGMQLTPLIDAGDVTRGVVILMEERSAAGGGGREEA